jgi:YidC/Oxa1 family membrane protein insertase
MTWFTVGIFEPLFNALLYIQKILPGHDLGIAIILLTLVIKAALYIPSLSGIRASRQLQTLQPKLKAIQAQYKDNKEKLAQEQMKLYKESKVNPLSSCLPLLIQIPFFIGLYQVFISGLKIDQNGILGADTLKHVYPFLRGYYETTSINTMFLGFVNLVGKKGIANIVFALLAGATQFWQTKMLAAPKEPNIKEAKDESMTSATNKQMTYMLPLFTAYLAYTFPAGLALYWTTQSVLTIAQQYIFLRRHPVASAVTQVPNDQQH